MENFVSAAEPESGAESRELVAAMAAYQAGELDGFRRLYAGLAGDLRRFFERSARDRAVAEDLLQEAFLQIHRSRHTYQPELPVRPWAFGVARHVLGRHRRDVLRHARHQGPELSALEEKESPALAAPVGAPAIGRREIENALAGISPVKRDAWLLHHVHGFSFQEIARRLSIGAGAAKLRSSRAMKALRESLGIRVKEEHEDG
jgi:RNA polymerase sigma-70 factor, ECF subfamily